MDLVAFAIRLNRYKVWIAVCGVAAALLGAAIAYTTPRSYYSQAIITPKQSGPNKAGSLLAGLGGLEGIVASSIGGGNGNLDHLEIMVRSRAMAESVIVRNGLLPALYPDKWDAQASKWKDPSKAPEIRKASEFLSEKLLSVGVDAKKNLLTMGVFSHDSLLARRIVEYYLKALSDKIRENVQSDADSNQSFLQKQLLTLNDPLLREKIQSLISGEIEKAMLVSSKSFDILESPDTPMKPSKPNRALIVGMSGAAGLFLSLLFFVALIAFRDARRASNAEGD